MAGNVDNRIMQLQFENRQFEKNIAKSKKSIDELKACMNFDETSKGLNKFSQSIDALSFSKLENNIQRLTDKFTGLGTVGELVVSQIRRHIESAAHKISNFIDSMTTAQVHAGLAKYEELNKNIQTIMAATQESEEYVSSVLDRLNRYTDQTSYNFTDMAANIGKFTSVGIPLEQAERQMEGIANWAARSGAGINEASRAMYNLSQAMGVGALTKIDWKSIENAGMATKEFREELIKAGLAAGTLVNEKGVVKTAKSLGKQVTVTYENVAETLNKKWANKTVIGNTLERYYYDDLYWENEQKAVVELEDKQKEAFDKIIESKGKLDQVSYKSLENLGVWTDANKQKFLDLAVSQKKLTETTDKEGKKLYTVVGKNGKKINFTFEQFQESLKHGWMDKSLYEAATTINELASSSYEAAQKCKSFTDVLNAWKDQISTGWMNSFKQIFGGLAESMEFFSNVCDRVGDALKVLIKLRNDALETWARVGGRESLIKILLGDYGSDMKTGAYGFLDILGNLKDLLFGGFKDFMMLFARPLDKQKVAENPEYFSTYLGYLLSDVTENIQNFMTRIGQFLNGEVAYNGKITTRLEMIREVVSGIAGTIKIAYDIVTKVLDFLGRTSSDLAPGFDSILGFLGELGKSIYGTADEMSAGNKIGEFFDNLRETVFPITDALNHFLISISGLLTMIFGLGEESATQEKPLKKIGEVILKVAGTIAKIAGPVITFIGRIIDLVTELFKGGFSTEKLKLFGKGVLDAFNLLVDELPEPVKKIITWIKGFFTEIKEAFESGDFTKLGDRFKGLFNKVIGLLPENIRTKLSEIVGKITGAFSKFWNKITGFLPENARESFNSVVGKITESIGGFWNKITGKAEKLADGKTNIVQTLIQSLTGKEKYDENGNLIEKKNIFSSIGGWITERFESLKEMMTGSVTNFDKESGKFKDAFWGVIESIKKWDWDKITPILMGVAGIGASLFLIMKIYKVFKKFSDGIGAIGDAIKNGFNLKLKNEDEKVETFGDKLLKIAGAIAIITICLNHIGNMKTSQAVQGLWIIGVILAALIATSFLIKAAYKEMDVKSGIAMFLGLYAIALAVSKLVKALSPLAGLQWDQYVKVFGGLALIVLAMWAIGKMADKGYFEKENMVGLTLFAVSLVILLSTLRTIKDANLTQLATMGGSLIVVIGTLIGAMALISKNKLSLAGKGLKEFIFLAFSIAILIGALNLIKSASAGQLGTMAGVLVGVLGILYVFMLIVNKTRGFTMEGTGMAQLLAVAFAVVILVLALIPLAVLPFGRVMGAVLAVGLLIAALVGVNKFISGTDGMTGTGMFNFILLAGAILILVMAMIPLALIPEKMLIKAGIALGSLIVILGLFTFVVGRYSKNAMLASGMKEMILLAAAIAVLAMVCIPLAMIPEEGLKRAVKAIGMIAVILLGFMVLMNLADKHFGSHGMSGSGMLGMVAFVLAIGVLVWTLMPLATLNEKQLIQLIVGMIFIVGALAGLIAVVKGMDVKGGVAGMMILLSMAALVIAFGAALTLVKDIDFAVILAFGAGLGIMAAGLASAVKKFAAMDPMAALKGILLLTVMIAAITVVIAVLAPLLIGSVMGAIRNAAADLAIIGDLISIFSDRIGGADEGALDKGGRVIDKITDMIWKMSGLVFIGGSISEFMLSMSRLTLAADEIIKFDDRISKVSEDGGAGKATAIIQGYEDMFTNHLSLFGSYDGYAQSFYSAMFNLGSGFDYFDDMTANMGSADENQGLQLIKQLAGCAPDLDTIYKMDLDTFKTQLAELGGAMIIYAKGAAAVNTGDETIIEDTDIGGAMILLQKISTSLSEAGGFTIPENMPTDTALTDFGVQLAALAGALVAFEEAGSGLGDGTEKALATLDFFTQLKSKLALMNLGSDIGTVLKSFVTGNGETVQKDELTQFGENIAALGSAMAHFASSTQIINEETNEITPIDYTLATTALESIASLNDKLPDVGGVKELIMGKRKSLGDLAAELNLLGDGIKEFHSSTTTYNENTGEVKPLDLTPMTTFLTSIVTAETDLNKIKINGWNFESLFAREGMTFDDLATQLTQLGSGLSIFASSITGVDENNNKKFDPDACTEAMNLITTSIVPTLQDLQGKLPDVGGLIDGVKTAWNGRPADLTDVAKEVAAIGPALNLLSVSIAGGTASDGSVYEKFDEACLKTTEEAITNMVDFLNSLRTKLPKVGGLVNIADQFMNGRPGNLNDLISDVEQIAPALNAISVCMTGGTSADNKTYVAFDKESIKKTEEAITEMADFLNTIRLKLPRVGGLTKVADQFWNGSTANIIWLTDQFRGVGPALNDLSIPILGGTTANGKTYQPFDGSCVEAVRTTLDAMADLLNAVRVKLPTVGGLVNIANTFWNGREGNLKDLGDQMGGISEGLGKFGDSVNGKFQNVTDIDNAIKAIDGIIGLMIHLSTASNLSYMSSTIVDYAHGLNMFLDAFVNGLKDAEGNQMYYSGLQAMMEIAEWVSKELDELPDIKTDNLKKFALLTEALQNLATIDLSKTSDFKNVGLSIATGIKEGIKEGTSIVTKAAQDLAVETYKSTMKALEANSPSKVFIKVGSYVGMGMARGIDQKSKLVGDAASTMAVTSLVSAQKSLGIKTKTEGSRSSHLYGSYVDVGMANGLLGSMGLVSSSAAVVAQSLLESMRDSLGVHSPSTEAMEIVDMVALGFTKEADKQVDNVADHMAEFGKESAEAVQVASLEELRAAGVTPAMMRMMAEDAKKAALNSTATFNDITEEEIEKASEKPVGFGDIISAYVAGGSSGLLKATAKAFGHEVIDEEEKAVKESAEETGNIYIDTIADGLSGKSISPKGKNAVLDLASQVSELATDAIGYEMSYGASKSTPFFNLFSDLLFGKGGGVKNLEQEVVESVEPVIGQITDIVSSETVDKAWDSISGVRFVSSLLFGTGGKKNLEKEAAENVETVVSVVGQALAEEVDANPVITPVLDLEQAKNDLATFNEYFNNGNYLDVAAQSRNAGKVQTPNTKGQNTDGSNTKTDLTGVLGKIAEMSGQIEGLGTSIKGMKLVLDTGVVAGGVTDKVDELIGQKIWLLQRNNSV